MFLQKLALFFILTLSCYAPLYSQQSDTTAARERAEVFLTQDQVTYNVYSTAQKTRIIARIMNDTVRENYPMLEVLEVANDMYKVDVASLLDSPITGWIGKAGIGTNTRPYYHFIELYEKPVPGARHKKVSEFQQTLVSVTDVSGSWVKVRFKRKSILYIGWLPYKYQCPAVYTTCN